MRIPDNFSFSEIIRLIQKGRKADEVKNVIALELKKAGRKSPGKGDINAIYNQVLRDIRELNKCPRIQLIETFRQDPKISGFDKQALKLETNEQLVKLISNDYGQQGPSSLNPKNQNFNPVTWYYLVYRANFEKFNNAVIDKKYVPKAAVHKFLDGYFEYEPGIKTKLKTAIDKLSKDSSLLSKEVMKIISLDITNYLRANGIFMIQDSTGIAAARILPKQLSIRQDEELLVPVFATYPLSEHDYGQGFGTDGKIFIDLTGLRNNVQAIQQLKTQIDYNLVPKKITWDIKGMEAPTVLMAMAAGKNLEQDIVESIVAEEFAHIKTISFAETLYFDENQKTLNHAETDFYIYAAEKITKKNSWLDAIRNSDVRPETTFLDHGDNLTKAMFELEANLKCFETSPLTVLNLFEHLGSEFVMNTSSKSKRAVYETANLMFLKLMSEELFPELKQELDAIDWPHVFKNKSFTSVDKSRYSNLRNRWFKEFQERFPTIDKMKDPENINWIKNAAKKVYERNFLTDIEREQRRPGWKKAFMELNSGQ